MYSTCGYVVDLDNEWSCDIVAANPACDEVGCGEWSAPMIQNPSYKGKWKAPLIDNPEYDVSQ